MDKLKNNEKQNKCFCPICPLYSPNNREEQEKTFCTAHEAGHTMDSNKTCVCSICPVFHENHLTNGFFCIREIEK